MTRGQLPGWRGGPSKVPRITVTNYATNCATAGAGSAVYGLPSGVALLSIALQTTGALSAGSALLTSPVAEAAEFDGVIVGIGGSPVIPVYLSGSTLSTRVSVASGVVATGTLSFIAAR